LERKNGRRKQVQKDIKRCGRDNDKKEITELTKNQNVVTFTKFILTKCPLRKKGKVIPLHAMEAHGGRGSIAPTHS
jgi:phage regulator Rha-like protein